MNILDIGANDGWWYKQTQLQYPEAKFVLIEANPNNEPSLISDVVKQVEFYITTDSPTTTGASYYLENTEHFNESNIQILNLTTTTLDLLFPTETFDIIKLDVQGSEVDIINGGQNLIRRASEIILEVPKPGVVYNIGAPEREMYFDVMYKAGFTTYEVLSEINNLQQDIRFIRS